MQENWDVIILGAGGAGLYCAATAGKRGRRTLVLDHANRLGQKILISGGGRCNFTNANARPEAYYSQNEHFAKSALSRHRPEQFLDLVHKHEVPFYEKKLGQLFCRDSAQSIVNLLRQECEEAGAEIRLQTKIEGVERLPEEAPSGARFLVRVAGGGELTCASLVVATGGLSIPKIGATDFGHRLARKFGLKVTELSPALVSLSMPQEFLRNFGELSGVSFDAEATANGKTFRENVLFTHTGFSGPAILQVSLHWFPGESIRLNLAPEKDLEKFFLAEKRAGNRRELKNLIGEFLSDRLAERLCVEFAVPPGPVAQVSDQALRALAQKLHCWELWPSGTGGYAKAEVTRGGVSTDELSSRTLEAKKVPGLYFIGEVVDVTGWLGGYNFAWAWASGFAVGESV